jgi:hypothetical protein
VYENPSGSGLPVFQLSGPHHGCVGLITYISSSSTALRASSVETSTSWSFSPGRMPVTSIWQPGAMASARSRMVMLGIFGTKTSPPCMCSRQCMTNRTPWSSVIQNRVIRLSVIVTVPVLRWSAKTGMTLPREPTTLP